MTRERAATTEGARLRLIGLHGFLGSRSDWDELAGWFPGARLHALDLWKVLGDSAAHDWASASAALDRALAETVTATGPGEPAFVVAYSLGARLALGTRLLWSPGSPFRGCIFVSCHPGLAEGDRAGRDARRGADEAWARRILGDPEQALWDAWDAQPVLAASARPARRGGLPAPRQDLARALRACSLAGQPDFRGRLVAWPTPILWLTGARDSKFVAVARDLQSAGVPADFVTCEDAGHRVPWDHPSAFARIVRAWTARVLERQT